MSTGIIQRVTNGVPQVPTTLDRLASWFERSAITRAAATLGNDDAMQAAPNIVPMQKPSRLRAVVKSVCLHCRDNGYGRHISKTAARVAVERLRDGLSPASAAFSAKLRADHLADVYGPKHEPKAVA